MESSLNDAPPSFHSSPPMDEHNPVASPTIPSNGRQILHNRKGISQESQGRRIPELSNRKTKAKKRKSIEREVETRSYPQLEKTSEAAGDGSVDTVGGAEDGRRLLNTLGTVKAVLNASPSQLTQAAGIPPATATKIHRLINQPYSEEHPTGEQQKEVEEYT